MMYRTVRAAALLLVLGFAVRAAAEPPPDRPRRASEIAVDVIAALDAKDEAEVKRLAQLPRPGGWSVADQLLLGRRADAARAVAKYTEDPDRGALAAYVEAWAERPEQPEVRAAIAAADAAFAKRDLEGGLRALEGVKGEGLPGLWVLNGRAVALRVLQRSAEAEAAAMAAGEYALGLGWLFLAGRHFYRVTQLAGERTAWEVQLGAWDRLSEVYKRQKNDGGLAAARVDRGLTLGSLGRHDEAAESHAEGLELARTAGRRDVAANGLVNLGLIVLRRRDLAKARTLLEEGLALQQAVGNRAYAARARSALAQVAAAEVKVPEARRLFEEALAEQEAAGDKLGALSTLDSYIRLVIRFDGGPAAEPLLERMKAMGVEAAPPLSRAAALLTEARVDKETGRLDEARQRVEQAAATYRRLGDHGGLGGALIERASVENLAGGFAAALTSANEALEIAEASGDKTLRAGALAATANAYARLGVLDRALELHQQAVGEARAEGQPARLMLARFNLGFAHLARGEFAPALQHTLAARELARKFGAARQLSDVDSNLGAIYMMLGDRERAEALMRGVLEAETERGEPSRLAAAKINLAALLSSGPEVEQARVLLREGLELARASGSRLWEMNALGNLANLDAAAERYQEAYDKYAAALALAEAMESGSQAPVLRSEMAWLLWHLGRREEALAEADAAHAAAREGFDLEGIAFAGLRYGQMLAEAGDGEKGLWVLRSAVDAYRRTRRGIPTTAGIDGAGFWQALQDPAMKLALANKSSDVAFEFIERVRAGQFLAGLGGRARVTEDFTSRARRQEELEKRVALLLARRTLASVSKQAKLSERRAARAAVEKANAEWLDALGRLELEASRARVVVSPPAPRLESFARSLAETEAYVAYASTAERGLALVVTRSGSKLVDLGALDTLSAGLDRVQPEDRGGFDAAALAQARGGVWDALELPAACTHVLVSPDIGMSYVPWTVLAGDRTVSLVPSASVIGVMRREKHASGEGVLALGDPAYGTRPPPPWVPSGLRGAGLTPLPATRGEVKAVGDVVLLGKQANETDLREALASRPRWHSLHLACHGLADEVQPLRGALAVTPDAREDGFLTVAEIYRAHVPADLVVLSACESARGREAAGAGAVGFPSAFLLAGADRVIASLWKVDDEATRALMTRFYELWRPREAGAQPLPPGEALRRAQAHVRDHPDHPEWKHPRYWAAWVLWGLP